MVLTATRDKSNGSGFNHNFQRSISPSGRFCSSSSAFSSFATRPEPSSFMTRPTSPTRVNYCRSRSPTPSVRFSASPSRSIVVSPRHPRQSNRPLPSNQKKTCMCSPTTHPGSFRCSLHKNANNQNYQSTSSYHRPRHQLQMRRSAMTNSLVRIGTVEGDLVKRALAALIRPSSHNLRRRSDFQPRPSRLSTMSKAAEE
ncbi:hypothetical protein M9H77_29241 [Catharanthus roseus]|uniref:Uncharacterized protein n=1 Tax=Catharanthus roseus TaxID=4058 RepID=A0ACC0AHN2_CATRO|nr:hypothetical protein M9H77_29241 [Catharanthus roseus]